MRFRPFSNAINVVVYGLGSSDPINDFRLDMANISGLRFSTGYPGGIYLDCEFFVQRDLVDFWQSLVGCRLHVFNNAITPVWEGKILNLDYVTDDNIQGIRVTCVGMWAWIAMRRMWKKQWCDTSTNEDAWARDETYAEQFDFSRQQNGIRMVCKHGDFTNPTNSHIYYEAPTGQVLKRVTYDYNFAEAVGSTFKAALFEDTGSGYTVIAASEVASTATGTMDITLSANCTKVKLQLYPVSVTSTIADNDWTYVEFKKIAVYTETGTIDLAEVAKDARAYMTDVNTSDAFITSMGGLSRSLVGTPSSTYGDTNYPSNFGSEGSPLAIADLLYRAASYGDSNNDTWAVGFLDSLNATSYDGKPLMYVEKVPELDDYEYEINLADIMLMPTITIQQSAENLSNYVYVTYKDPVDGNRILTPDDDAGLKDDTSIAIYGRQDNNLSIGNANEDLAKANGKRYLKRYKNPRWVLSDPIKLIDRVRTKAGYYVPASHVQAGERVLVYQDNFGFGGQELTGGLPGEIFLISSTEFDTDSNSIVLTAGPPPDLIWPVYVTPRSWDELDTSRKIDKPYKDERGGGYERPEVSEPITRYPFRPKPRGGTGGPNKLY